MVMRQECGVTEAARRTGVNVSSVKRGLRRAGVGPLSLGGRPRKTPWQKGHLTDFSPDRGHLYREAVRRYGDLRFVIAGGIKEGRMGLYYRGKLSDDLQPFWKIFRKVEKEFNGM